MKTALVIGAHGFVGRHLVPKLKALGYDITQVDPAFPAGSEKSYVCRATFEQWLRWENRKPTYDLVVHLGAHIKDIDARMKAGISAYEDIKLDYEVCKFVEATKPGCFIAMSSCAVDYPADPYCIIKRTLEAFVGTLVKNGQQVRLLRPFSGYGFDQTDDYPFPSIMKRVLKGEDPVTVWGGSQVRDWLHIDDLVDGIIYSINNFPNGVPIELGTRIGTTFYKLAAAILYAHDVTCSQFPPREIVGDQTKAQSSSYRVAGCSGPYAVAADLYGWSPKITLAEGIVLEMKKALADTSNRFRNI